MYVTVTQCDLLAGFVEFFHAMGREERAQIWGMTFPVRAGDEVGEALSTFPDRFLELEQRLQVGVLERMQQERDLQRRALLYGFPQQFAAIGDVLGDFLNKVFQVTRYEDTAFLRGVYFTSGGQEGSPNNRGKAPLPAGGRSYFITTLLRELIFKESELAGTDRNFERSRQRMRWMAVGFAGLMLALAGTGLATSYFRNQQYVADVSARSFQLSRLAKTTSSQDSLIAMLPLLNAARQLPGGYAERDNSVPLLNRFGLSQAGKLGAEEQVLYLRLLRSVLIPRLVSRLEEVLRRGDANNQEYVYEALRVYLMLGKPQHHRFVLVRGTRHRTTESE
ncbi:type VI secretion protein IcmF/TssM N-terminal domain-containing protein, partial [Glaciimonas sp. GG7]